MSVNKVILVGRVGKDPDIKYFESDTSVANFPLATSERGFKAANGTVVPERTEWHNIVCWRGLAKIAEQFVKKGTLLYIEGKIKTRSYEDRNGVKKYITEIFADNLELLGRKSDNDAQQSDRSYVSDTGNLSSDASSPVDTSSEVDDLPF